MLSHAMITISNLTGEAIAIPVINFPVLPDNSLIDLFLTDEIIIEDAIIERYGASNKYGTRIIVDITGADCSDQYWNELAKLCVRDPVTHYDWIYPHIIDFGVKFPMPPT